MPIDSELQQRRMKIWRHNSFLGGCAMARTNMHAIMNASTTTVEAQCKAAEIMVQLEELTQMLKTRVGP